MQHGRGAQQIRSPCMLKLLNVLPQAWTVAQSDML